MQLSRDELLSAYQTMKTIRVFEDRVNQEMGSGDIPGAVHLMLVKKRRQLAFVHFWIVETR